MLLPFWSFPWAVNVCVAPADTVAGFGVTVIVVRTGGGGVPPLEDGVNLTASAATLIPPATWITPVAPNVQVPSLFQTPHVEDGSWLTVSVTFPLAVSIV